MFEMDPGSESSRYSGEMIDFCKQKAREHAIQYMSELAEYHLEHGLRNDPFLDGMSEELVQVFVQEFSGLFGKVPQRPSPSKSPNRPVNRRRWSTIFHFKHSDKEEGISKKPRGSCGSRSDLASPEDKSILLVSNMKVLSWNDSISPKEKWVACRIALVVEHEMQKIEIYVPPKSTQPKTCIFCFLLEEIRNTTSLEVPDTDSAFVIKPEDAPGHVLIAEDVSVRDMWVTKLQRAVIFSKNLSREGESTSSVQSGTPVFSKNLSCSGQGFLPSISTEDLNSEECNSPIRRNSTPRGSRSPVLESRQRVNGSLLSVPSSSTNAALHPVSVQAEAERKLSLPGSSPKSKVKTVGKVSSMENLTSSPGVTQTQLSVPNVRQNRDLSPIDDNSGTELVDIQALIRDMDLTSIVSPQEGQPERRNTIAAGNVPRNASNREEETGPNQPANSSSVLSSLPSQERSSSSLPSSPGIAGENSNSSVFALSEMVDPMVQMFRAPWYHGILLRHDCSMLLQSLGQDATGRYLVRKSESVDGEYVLSFNYQGRAKHLRMSVNSDGSCKMQHLNFPSVGDMLEHFKNNAIPLESPTITDSVTLTTYVSSAESSQVRVDYNAFQQSRSNSTLRGRAQSFSTSSNFIQPSFQLRVGGRAVSRAVDNIYVRT